MTTHEDNWYLAESVQLTPAPVGIDADGHGVVSARPHPTGWFICARHRPDLTPGDVEDFAQFVRVRTYLLLEDGPQNPAWHSAEDGSWRAVCEPSRLDLVQDVEAFR